MNVNAIIDRYKRQRSRQQLRSSCKGEYAFVGVGGHSTANLYPILDYLHVPLKYICCNTPEKVPLIERKWRGVHATTALCDVLSDKEIKGVFVSASPSAHFGIAKQVLECGKSLFVEKPPCLSSSGLIRLIQEERAGTSPVIMVGMQKRHAPATRLLAGRLRKDRPRTYNLRYLTGLYPEGDELSDLFIHPLDYVTWLFGKAELKGCETQREHGGLTLQLLLRHKDVCGLLELSTAYSWTNAHESLTVNTRKGVYELIQMENLRFSLKQGQVRGFPLEKVFRRNTVTESLFSRNNFVPTTLNNQLYTQGYFNEIASFVEAVEKNSPLKQPAGFSTMADTYELIDCIRERI